jgi:hypothetical protein
MTGRYLNSRGRTSAPGYLPAPVALSGSPQRPVTTFSTASRARLRRARPGRARPKSRARTRKSEAGIASWSGGEPPEPGGQRRDAPTPGRQPAAPYGREPTGRGGAAGRQPRPPRRRYRLQRAHSDRVGASWPGRRSDAVRADSHEKDHRRWAGTPHIVRRGPSSVKGTRRSFLTAPQKGSSGPTLECRSLCRPSGLTARARTEARP